MYVRSTKKNEFWSALLEKAYAKLHGSYEALIAGNSCDALEDFTGGITEVYLLKEAPENLFQILEKGFQRKSMIGCSIDPDPLFSSTQKNPQGLVCGHAYSITKTVVVNFPSNDGSSKIPLLRVRNPWGNETEWNGAWCDKSPEWQVIPEETKIEIGLTFDNDGEFWINLPDFFKYFATVEICNLGPEAFIEDQGFEEKRDWFIDVFEGQWVTGISAGGNRSNDESFYRNPQYVITFEDSGEESECEKCSVVVALMQKNRRSKHLENLVIGFYIYQLSDEDLDKKPQPKDFFNNHLPVAKSQAFNNLRETTFRFSFLPGKYLIVPTTYKPDYEGDFLIRVFSESEYTFEENDENVGIGDADVSCET